MTEIGERAFSNCTSLTSVTIGNGVTTIGRYAFYGCTSLASVVIPGSVTAIGECAFEGCTWLESVTIPSSVTAIGASAFYGCTSLTSVTIPDSVTEIGGLAFSDCTSLTEIQFKGTRAQWQALQGSSRIQVVLVRCSDGHIGIEVPEYLKIEGTTVTGYTDTLPANLVIPDGVTEIGERAFGGCMSLTSVVIPDSVREIRNYAFSGCTSLTEIQFKGTTAQWRAIRGRAIQGSSETKKVASIRCSDGSLSTEEVPEYLKIEEERCSGYPFADFVIPNVVTGYIGDLPANLVIPEGVTKIGSSAFKKCTSLSSVTIPSSVTTIGVDAFRDCTVLVTVTILDGVKTIDLDAFYGCTSLATVTIPGSVTAIGNYAFSGCTSLTEIQFKGTTAQWQAIQGSSRIQGAVVRCSDGRIGIEEIPEYLKIDGTEVTGYTGKVPANLVIPDGVTKIGYLAFSNCKLIGSVTIPGSVTSIGGSAFYNCTNLTSVNIPGSMKKIDADTFYGCTNLTSVMIPDTVTAIGSNAFKGCTSLASVTIPGSMKKIDAGTFYGCTSLASVTISGSVEEIADSAFAGCTSLKKVQFGGTTAQWKALKGSNGVKVPYILCSDGYIGIKDLPAYLKMDGYGSDGVYRQSSRKPRHSRRRDGNRQRGVQELP